MSGLVPRCHCGVQAILTGRLSDGVRIRIESPPVALLSSLLACFVIPNSDRTRKINHVARTHPSCLSILFACSRDCGLLAFFLRFECDLLFIHKWLGGGAEATQYTLLLPEEKCAARLQWNRTAPGFRYLYLVCVWWRRNSTWWCFFSLLHFAHLLIRCL